MHILTSKSKPADLLRQIYAETHVLGYSNSYRPRKLRKVCETARGLDLRKPADVIYLARALNIIATPTPVVETPVNPNAYPAEIKSFGSVFTSGKTGYDCQDIYFTVDGTDYVHKKVLSAWRCRQLQVGQTITAISKDYGWSLELPETRVQIAA